MFTIKRLMGILSAALVLLLVPGVPAMAQEAPSEESAVEAQVSPGQGTVRAVQFSPDGTRMAVGGGANIRLYDAHTREVVSLFAGHAREVLSVAFSPDGQILASGSDDHTVRLWDIATGTLLHTLEGHTGRVHEVAFSRNGRTLASGSDDHTVRLWDIATGTLRHILEDHTESVYSVAFSPDGRTLASGSGDHTVRLWDVAAGIRPPHLGEPYGSGLQRGIQSERTHPGQWQRRPHRTPLGCGRGHPPPHLGEPHGIRSTKWCSVRMDAFWPAAVATTPYACGMRPRAPSAIPWRTMRIRSTAWRSVGTDAPWPVAAATTPYASGTWPRAPSVTPWRTMRIRFTVRHPVRTNAPRLPPVILMSASSVYGMPPRSTFRRT